MESAADHVNRLTGRATTAELVAATSRRRLATALRRGELVRFSRGLYTLPGRRYDELVAAGWLVLRFTCPQLIGEPAATIDLITRTLKVRTNR